MGFGLFQRNKHAIISLSNEKICKLICININTFQNIILEKYNQDKNYLIFPSRT